MFQQLGDDGDEPIDGYTNDVADGDEIVAAVGLGGEVLHGPCGIVGTLLADRGIEPTLA